MFTLSPAAWEGYSIFAFSPLLLTFGLFEESYLDEDEIYPQRGFNLVFSDS